MKKRIGLISLIMAMALVLLGAVSAQALPQLPDGTFGLGGTVLAQGGSAVNTWTNIDFYSNSTVSALTQTGFWGSMPNGTNVTTAGSIHLGSGSVSSDFLSWTFSGDTYTFHVTSEQVLSLGSNNATIYLLGTVSDSLGTYDPASTASLNFAISMNQLSSNGTWSGTWASPAQAPTPEPASMVLFGLGLGIMGYIGYRRKSQKQINLVAGI